MSIPPNSFSFRVTCYETFGWTPDTIKKLPDTEALLLAVYFEERIKHDQEVARELERKTSSNTPSATHGFETVERISDEDDE